MCGWFSWEPLICGRSDGGGFHGGVQDVAGRKCFLQYVLSVNVATQQPPQSFQGCLVCALINDCKWECGCEVAGTARNANCTFEATSVTMEGRPGQGVCVSRVRLHWPGWMGSQRPGKMAAVDWRSGTR